MEYSQNTLRRQPRAIKSRDNRTGAYAGHYIGTKATILQRPYGTKMGKPARAAATERKAQTKLATRGSRGKRGNFNIILL